MKHEPTSLEKEGEFESPDDDELEWALLNDPSIAQAFQDPVVLDLTEISPSVSPIKRPRISDCIQDRMSPIQLSEILKDSRLSG